MTLPEVGERVVVRMDSVVVLPAPFGPRREKNSPASTVNEMSSRALSAADVYRLMRCSTSIITVIFLVYMYLVRVLQKKTHFSAPAWSCNTSIR